MISFAVPQAFALLLLPFLIYYLFPAALKMYGDALKFPFVQDIIKIKNNSSNGIKLSGDTKVYSFLKLFLLALLWGAIVLALSRPQWVGEPLKVKHEGRDILLVVDISTSMNERDFEYQGRIYDRLSAVKSVVSRFVDERADDRIGLVLFGTRAYLQSPLTYDKQALKNILQDVDAGMAGNSTSIGDAVGLALKNLAISENQTQNKVIILLTDGENNDGRISVPEAIKLAAQENVKIYTIGVGSDTEAFLGGLFRISTGSGLDEASLKQLADATKGNYFRAKDVASLLQIYDEINQLEAVEQQGRFLRETKDLFYYPAAIALLLFLLLIVMKGSAK